MMSLQDLPFPVQHPRFPQSLNPADAAGSAAQPGPGGLEERGGGGGRPPPGTHQQHRAAHHLRHALPQLGRRARLTQRPGELPSLRRGGEQRRLRHPRRHTAPPPPRPLPRSGRARPRRRQVRPPHPAGLPAAPGAAARSLPPPLAARPGGAARAAPSAACHGPRRPPLRPRFPELGAALGLARRDRACGGGCGSPMPPASLGGRSPGRLLGAGCPARRGAGRAEEGPARRDSRPGRSSRAPGGQRRAAGSPAGPLETPPPPSDCSWGRTSEDPRRGRGRTPVLEPGLTLGPRAACPWSLQRSGDPAVPARSGLSGTTPPVLLGPLRGGGFRKVPS